MKIKYKLLCLSCNHNFEVTTSTIMLSDFKTTMEKAHCPKCKQNDNTFFEVRGIE